MRYLLDTHIVSDLIRNPQGRVAQRIREVGETQVDRGRQIYPSIDAQFKTSPSRVSLNYLYSIR